MRKFIDIASLPPLNEVQIIKPLQDGINGDRLNLLSNETELSQHYINIGSYDSFRFLAQEWPIESYSYVLIFANDGELVGKANIKNNNVARRGHTFADTYTVSHIYLRKKYRNIGIGYALYSCLLNKGFRILSDTVHTKFSKFLWAKLAQNYTMDIIDVSEIEETTIASAVKDIASAYRSRYKRLLCYKN